MLYSEKELEKCLKAGCALYYFYASDEALVHTAAQKTLKYLNRDDPETTVLDGPTPSVEEIVLAAGTISFFGGNDTLRDVLVDILDTPVSPELLPTAADGTIAQQTEKLVGPYELHDFYLYYVLRFGFSPTKIYHLARTAFDGRYEPEVLLAWLKNFYRRFFAQQFKRSCLPDGPKVGSVTLSPRGDWRMPSDACNTLWMAELEKLEV